MPCPFLCTWVFQGLINSTSIMQFSDHGLLASFLHLDCFLWCSSPQLLNPHFLGEKSQRQCYLSETPLKKCYIRLWKLKVTGPQVKAEQNSFQCHLFQHQCQTPSLLVHAGHRCLWFTEQLHSKKGYAPSSITAGHHDQLRRCWRNNLFPLVYPSGCPIHLFENAGRLMNRNATPCRKTHVRKEWRGRAGSK